MFVSRFMILTVSLFMVGCGGGSQPAHPTTETAVTVIYQGKSVEGATVTFVNREHESPVTAVGRTDAEGIAQMKTYREGDGAIKGFHSVSILKSAVSASPSGVTDTDSEHYDPYAANAPAAAPQALIPLKYSSSRSGLTIEVGDTPVTHTFELVD